MNKTLIRKYWHYVLIGSIFIICYAYILVYFSINSEVIIQGLYFIGVFTGYFIVRRLKIFILNLGWELFALSLFIDFLDGIYNFPYLLDFIFDGLLGLIGLITVSLGIYRVVKEYEERERKISFLSFHDELSGLYNRRYFENEIERLNDSRLQPISIIIADLDGLKKINDTLGHRKGDKLIKEAGIILNSVTREEDIVARIGGDEFAVILPGTDMNSARDIYQRIEQECNSYNQQVGELKINISLGYATRDDKNTDIDKIIMKADQMMYREKAKSYTNITYNC